MYFRNGLFNSAECDQLYEAEKDNEKAGGSAASDVSDLEENTGFAIVINGHSLVHCLSSELEHR